MARFAGRPRFADLSTEERRHLVDGLRGMVDHIEKFPDLIIEATVEWKSLVDPVPVWPPDPVADRERVRNSAKRFVVTVVTAPAQPDPDAPPTVTSMQEAEAGAHRLSEQMKALGMPIDPTTGEQA